MTAPVPTSVHLRESIRNYLLFPFLPCYPFPSFPRTSISITPNSSCTMDYIPHLFTLNTLSSFSLSNINIPSILHFISSHLACMSMSMYSVLSIRRKKACTVSHRARFFFFLVDIVEYKVVDYNLKVCVLNIVPGD